MAEKAKWVGRLFNGYNPRRWGIPWGAVITFNGSKPEFNFDAANYVGGADDGSSQEHSLRRRSNG